MEHPWSQSEMNAPAGARCIQWSMTSLQLPWAPLSLGAPDGEISMIPLASGLT